MSTILAAQADIAAPAERVREILEDFEAYPEWNPFTPRVQTSRVVGEPVVMHVRMKPGGKTRIQRETLRALTAGAPMAWGLDWGRWLHTHREQHVESLEEGRCRYVTTNEFRGWLAPLVMALYRDNIERGFQAVAEALAARAEGAGSTSAPGR